jgi:hypothetical protein
MSSYKKPEKMPAQHQEHQPGRETEMNPRPIPDRNEGNCSRLRNRSALITGGDSGIGRAVALDFAKEGADIAIVYLNEHKDAEQTRDMIKEMGRRCQ